MIFCKWGRATICLTAITAAVLPRAENFHAATAAMMRTKKPKVTRWSSPDDPNGNVSYEIPGLSATDLALGLEILHAQAAKDRVDLIWSDDDWKLVVNFRLRYANGRSKELNALPDNDDWDSLVSLVREGCQKLTEAMERRGFSSNQLWREIGNYPELPELQKDRFRTLIDALKNRAEKSHGLNQTLVAKTHVNVGDAWSVFIARLSEQWRSKGLKPTASKSDETKPSPFVVWVAFWMGSLSELLQQHMHSARAGHWVALSQAVGEARRDSKRVLALIGDLGATVWASHHSEHRLRQQIAEWRDTDKYPNPEHQAMADDAETFLNERNTKAAAEASAAFGGRPARRPPKEKGSR